MTQEHSKITQVCKFQRRPWCVRKANKRGKNSNLMALHDNDNNNNHHHHRKGQVSILTIKSNFGVEHFGVVLLCLVIGLRFFATFLINRSKTNIVTI